ncbi:MAG: TetR family transcriptional regulator [Alphaproteobacteria bacterium]
MSLNVNTRRAKEAEPSVRTQDPEGTRRNIVEVATREFAEHGLAGARIDEIAAKTRSSKRMIYYYFGDKEGLYLQVLEAAYSRIRQVEATLHLDDLEPAAALRRLVEFTFDHHNSNEPFVRLVMIENIHHGTYLARSEAIQQLNVTAIDTIARVYDRGVAAGLFRPGIAAVDLHWHISALCFFSVSNRATFSKIFGLDLKSKPTLARLREQSVEMVLRFVARD